jgi:hypothetical protein
MSRLSGRTNNNQIYPGGQTPPADLPSRYSIRMQRRAPLSLHHTPITCGMMLARLGFITRVYKARVAPGNDIDDPDMEFFSCENRLYRPSAILHPSLGDFGKIP